MGARIVFFTANNEKSIQENFIQDYSKFRDWTLSNWNTSELRDQGQLSLGQEINKDAIQYLEKSQTLDTNISTELYDELLSVYFCSYCDYGTGKELYELRGPMMNKWKYKESTKLVNQKCDESTVELWNRLNSGCSTNTKLKSSHSLSKDILVGWWTVEEMKKMEFNLSKAFKSAYFFDEWNAMRRKGNSSNKSYSGLEYVYDVLDIGINENKEVVFYNEIH